MVLPAAPWTYEVHNWGIEIASIPGCKVILDGIDCKWKKFPAVWCAKCQCKDNFAQTVSKFVTLRFLQVFYKPVGTPGALRSIIFVNRSTVFSCFIRIQWPLPPLLSSLTDFNQKLDLSGTEVFFILGVQCAVLNERCYTHQLPSACRNPLRHCQEGAQRSNESNESSERKHLEGVVHQ